jgi:glycosyltransferase involved in cell wall biosynthesis
MNQNMPVSESVPDLTVIVASHNRRELLRRCLESLGEQTADPADFEVIVADDGSEDGTAEMAEAFQAPYPLRVLRLKKGSHAAAQNAALDAAGAEFCLLLDDDVIASPELVAGHIEGHRQHPRAIGIGALTQQPVDADDWYAHAYARGWEEHYAELATREAHWSDCYGANLSFPREAIREIGGVSIDIPSAKDFDLALRLCRSGCTPVFFPRAHGVHDDQKRSDRMIADAQRAGRMHVELSRRFPEAAPELLDWAAGASPRERAVRRLFLVLKAPIAPLVWMGRFLPGEGRKMIWLHTVRRLAFWSGVRGAIGRRSWGLINHERTAEAVAMGLNR